MPVKGPIPPFNNPDIDSDAFQPSQFLISNLTLGNTTIVTATVNMNYVIGQLVRLLIPVPFGSFQLNNLQGYVVSLPAANQVEIAINSTSANLYIATPFSANISGATNANHCILTTNQSVYGNNVLIQNVGGMTQLNGLIFNILSQTTTSIMLNVDSTTFSLYTSGGTATVFPTDGHQAQIIAVGEINSGIISSTGRIIPTTNIPGAFINISPT